MTEYLTDTQYWNKVWDGRGLARPLDPTDHALNNFMNVELDRYFRGVIELVAPMKGRPLRLVEAGCGGSTVLPYFQREFGFDVAGLDYSPAGCEISRAIHAAANVPGDVREGDLFDPPPDMIEAYDIVYSMGLVEHFRPTTTIIEALCRLCRDGGHLITLIPNLAGAMGNIQRSVNRPVYDLHVPLSLDQLVSAHRSCGLEVVKSDLIGTINLGVLNFAGPGSRIPLQLGQRVSSWISKSVWVLQRFGLPDMPNRWFSPYLACLARRP